MRQRQRLLNYEKESAVVAVAVVVLEIESDVCQQQLNPGTSSRSAISTGEMNRKGDGGV